MSSSNPAVLSLTRKRSFDIFFGLKELGGSDIQIEVFKTVHVKNVLGWMFGEHALPKIRWRRWDIP